MRKKLGTLGLLIMLVFAVAGSHKAGEYLYYNYLSEDTRASNEGIETAADIKGKQKNVDKNVDKKLVVVDAGHGGSDPGKVGVNNALEKDINLQIAKKVKALLMQQNVTVVMTREDQNGIADSKVEDMKKRVAIINETKPDLAVSIHQNSYHEESIHGAQVFYYKHSKKGEAAANVLQQALLVVDPENKRQAKANDTYYMLIKTEVPLTIVECGFLSNSQEADKLIDETYQDAMAEAVCQGILKWMEQ